MDKRLWLLIVPAIISVVVGILLAVSGNVEAVLGWGGCALMQVLLIVVALHYEKSAEMVEDAEKRLKTSARDYHRLSEENAELNKVLNIIISDHLDREDYIAINLNLMRRGTDLFIANAGDGYKLHRR